MFDHLSLSVRDLPRSVRFYAAALAPLDVVVHHQDRSAAGLGRRDAPQLWLARAAEVRPTHIAFRAASQEQVRQFHAAALAAGGTDNGAPGPRPHYHPSYYAAFVRDPDGHNIEAVCYAKE